MIRYFYNHARSKALKQIDEPKKGAFVVVTTPTADEIIQLAKNFRLDEDLLADSLDLNESPRIETYEKATYIYGRYCASDDSSKATLPVLIVDTGDVLILICNWEFPSLAKFLDQKIDFYTTQRTKLLLLILDEVVYSYQAEQQGINKRIRQFRSQLNKQKIENKNFVSMIDIEEELNDFLAALVPLNAVLRNLLSGRHIQLYEDDADLVEDLTLGIAEQQEIAKANLKTITNVREAYSTIMANNLNTVFKLMTSITVLMSIFTMVTGIYSMNIALPGAHNDKVFWVIIGVTGTLIVSVARIFRKKGWF